MGNAAKSESVTCAAILLAAGQGQRYGVNKITAAKLHGQPMGLVTAKIFAQVLPTFVVVRQGDKAAAQLFRDAGFETIVAAHASRGMGNSVAAGVTAIEAKGFDCCLIGLGDMPLVSETTVQQLKSLLDEGHEIVRPRYCGQAGNPVGFQRRYFKTLTALRDDQGARDVISAHPELLVYYDVDDPGVIADIDTPADLDAAQQTPT